MRKLLASLLLSISIFSSGCDTAKPEREALLRQIEQLDSELANLNTHRDEANRAIDKLNAEIQRLKNSLQEHSQRKTRLQDELASYLLDHKMATAAVIAAGGGAATFINKSIDEDTKTTLRLVGIVGALYCLGSGSECADVTAKGIYYGSQIESESKELTAVTAALSSAESALQEREKEHASVKNTINLKQAEREELKRKHDSLVCKFCI